MANTYTARFIGCTNPVTSVTKNFFTLYNYPGSTQVVRVYRAWMVTTNLTTAAGGTTGYGDYILDKFTSAIAPAGGAAVGLINHDLTTPAWPTATVAVITGTSWLASVATFTTTAGAAGTISTPGFTTTSATPFQTTCTTLAAHGLVAGQNVTIAGVTPAGFNGTYQVLSVPTTLTFTISVTGNPGAWVSGGTTVGGHSYRPGQNIVAASIVSSGTGGATYNGTWQIATVPTSNTFTTTATMNLNPGTWTSGGTIGPAVVMLLGNTSITGTLNSTGIIKQVARSNWSATTSTTTLVASNLQTLYPLNILQDAGYGDANVEPIVLRGGEGVRIYNVATPNGTWPTTAASVDIVLELTIS